MNTVSIYKLKARYSKWHCTGLLSALVFPESFISTTDCFRRKLKAIFQMHKYFNVLFSS